MASFDIKPSKWLNESKQGNFVFAPVGNVCNVQIFDKISMEKCAEMLGNLAQIITLLPTKPIVTVPAKIISPYDISSDTFVFDVAINSGGGELNAYNAIASMFAQAKARGAIVRTQNVGQASSAASMLAIQGTPGYRIMYENAFVFIHYGKSTEITERINEQEINAKNTKAFRNKVSEIYTKCTKLTAQEVEKYKTTEGSGQLFAKRCLSKHLCDWILTYDGQLIGRTGR